MRRRAALLALAALAAPGVATAQPTPLRSMPLPVHPPEVRLRMAYFHNPALPEPAPGFVAAVLAQAQRLAPSQIGLAVRFEGDARLDIREAFAHLPPPLRARALQQAYSPAATRTDRRRLVGSLRRQLAGIDRSFAALVAQARPDLLPGPDPADLDALAEALIESQLSRLEAWRPLHGDDQFHLFPAWIVAAETGRWPFELVITNQLVASAEYDWMELEATARAGVTNGITTQSPASAHGLVSVLTLYPFIGNDPTLVAMRGGLPGGGPDAVDWAAALLVHELGHQLLHLGHPPGNAACVMKPTPSLRFAEWVRQHDASRCLLGSEPAMTPGAVKFRAIGERAP